jgi:hypothetical protein
MARAHLLLALLVAAMNTGWAASMIKLLRNESTIEFGSYGDATLARRGAGVLEVGASLRVRDASAGGSTPAA